MSNGSQKEYVVTEREETARIAQALAKSLRGGEVLALSGGLGAGKTAFVQELAMALRVREQVTSPTFVIIKVYDVTSHGHFTSLCHVDAYRLVSPDELEAVGFGEYSGRADTVTAVEWPENVARLIPANAIKISFEILE